MLLNDISSSVGDLSSNVVNLHNKWLFKLGQELK